MLVAWKTHDAAEMPCAIACLATASNSFQAVIGWPYHERTCGLAFEHAMMVEGEQKVFPLGLLS